MNRTTHFQLTCISCRMSNYEYKAGHSTYWDNVKFPYLTAVKPDLRRTSCEKNSSNGRNQYAVSKYVANWTKKKENIYGRKQVIYLVHVRIEEWLTYFRRMRNDRGLKYAPHYKIKLSYTEDKRDH